VWIKKTNASEPPPTCRKCSYGVRTGEVMLLRDKSGGRLLTVQVAPGIEVA
jgi:uracil-DNA glycosylase